MIIPETFSKIKIEFYSWTYEFFSCSFFVMSKTKRLFLFAAYVKDGVVDKSLMYYVRALSDCGDVVLCMDSNCSDRELEKLKNFTVHTIARRHGEYDFGSYKRAFMWVQKNLDFCNYDFVYLVNDSVYGPVSNVKIDSILTDLEKQGDFIGMVSNQDIGVSRHIQSWFVGVGKRIATSKMFAQFISSIKKQKNKNDIVMKYEIGLSEFVTTAFHIDMHVLFEQDNHMCNTMYNKPYIPVKYGMPFIKKSAIRHMLSWSFLKKYIGNDILYNTIKLNGLHIKPRPIKWMWARLHGF